MKAADAGVAELEANVDSLIVILNDKLLDVLGDDVTQDQAFAHANDVLKNAVGGISDIIHMPGLVNVDFEDVQDGDERARQGDDGHGDRVAARTARNKAAEAGGGLPAARRHRPLGRARRAGADRGEPQHASSSPRAATR